MNATTPGPINTSMGGKMGLTPEQMADFGEMIAWVPLKRPGDVDEIAAAALYFASDDSRCTTGPAIAAQWLSDSVAAVSKTTSKQRPRRSNVEGAIIDHLSHAQRQHDGCGGRELSSVFCSAS
jgi:NAD(P)-dependent dehydrogenase (short-subunit alcohol dehydrogenase family)